MENKSPGIKGMRGLFIRQEGKFSHIRGKQIIGCGLAAHFGHIHKAGVSDQDGPPGHGLDGKEHPVVPVNVRLQVMKTEGREIAVWAKWRQRYS